MGLLYREERKGFERFAQALFAVNVHLRKRVVQRCLKLTHHFVISWLRIGSGNKPE